MMEITKDLIGKEVVLTDTKEEFTGRIVGCDLDYDPPYATVQWDQDGLRVNYSSRWLSKDGDNIRVRAWGSTGFME